MLPRPRAQPGGVIPWGAEWGRAVGGHVVGWQGHSRSPYLPRCCLPSPEGYCCLCGSENVTEANAAPAIEIAFSLQNKPSSHFSFSASLPQMQAALPAGSPSPCSPTLCLHSSVGRAVLLHRLQAISAVLRSHTVWTGHHCPTASFTALPEATAGSCVAHPGLLLGLARGDVFYSLMQLECGRKILTGPWCREIAKEKK